jgi:ABC-type uncharacterized transport system permease subunit
VLVDVDVNVSCSWTWAAFIRFTIVFAAFAFVFVAFAFIKMIERIGFVEILISSLVRLGFSAPTLWGVQTEVRVN